jgi:hypothetical protein
MKLSTRELVILTVFGTLWGAIEISLGSLLHLLNVPLSGAFLGAAGLAIALIGRLFVPRPGSTLYIGVVAMLLKLFSIGSVVLGPMVGILMEAVLAEAVLTLFGRPSRTAFVTAGALGVLWNVVQPFFTGLLFFGRSIFVVWLDLLDTGSRLFGLDETAVWAIVLGLAAIHLLIGAVAGWLAWDAGRALQERFAAPLPAVRN